MVKILALFNPQQPSQQTARGVTMRIKKDLTKRNPPCRRDRRAMSKKESEVRWRRWDEVIEAQKKHREMDKEFDSILRRN